MSPTDEKLKVHFRNEQGELDFESPALRVHERVTLSTTGAAGLRSANRCTRS